MSDMAIDLPLRPISVAEYHQMAEAGILERDERVELLGGMLVTMPPIGQRHVLTHGLFVQHLIERLGARAFISGQASIPLGRLSEPQPDITIFAPRVLAMRDTLWTVEDVYAVIEISDSSMRRDTGPKLRAYASGGIAEYCIVDVQTRTMIQHRDPLGPAYTTVNVLKPRDTFELLGVPGIELDTAAFFPID